jgi:RNA polymerase sigma-70 factor (ECF subfamily)
MARGFDDIILPHLDAAFNYACRLTRNRPEAEDVVQDACVKAMRFTSSLREGDGRSWLFAIVRNTWYRRLSRGPARRESPLDDAGGQESLDAALDPEEQLQQQRTVTRVRAALDELPVDFREVVVLRDIEGLSYKEISAVVGVPIGTVMSRLARGRNRLLRVLKPAAVGSPR